MTQARENEKKWMYVLPFATCLLAFVLRYHFFVTYPHPMMIHEQDAIGYMEVAKSFLHLHLHLHLPSVAGRPPGYPILIALFALLPVSMENAARLASIFMDALITVPLFFVARIFVSSVGSVTVCLLWAFFSFSLVFSPSPLSQSTYLFYLLSGIALLHRGLEKNELWWFTGAGACMALSYLTRPEGIIGFGCCFLICLTPLLRKNGLNKNNIRIPLFFSLGFLILAFPYLAALRINFGAWTLSPMSEAHVKTADAILTLTAKGELQKTGSTGLSVWQEHYKTLPLFFKAVWANIQAFASTYKNTFPTWMHIISGAGIVALIWKNPWRHSLLLCIPAAVIAPIFLVSIPRTHSYLYPVFTITFIGFAFCFDALAAAGGWAGQKFMPETKLGTLKISFIGVLFFIICYVAFESCKIANHYYRSPAQTTEVMVTENVYKKSGEFIKNNSGVNDIIMTRWGLIGYFADRPVLSLPKGGIKEVVEYGRKHGANFIMLDSNSVLSRRQELRELLAPLEGRAVDPAYGVETVSSNSFGNLGGYVIYRYKQ